MAAVAERKRSSVKFGPRLRALREAAGLTQTELGQRADMLYQTIAKYERGEREPTWGALLAIATALDVDLNAFLSDDDQPGDDPDPEPAPRPQGKRK